MAMNFETKVKRTVELVKSKLNSNYEAQVKYTGNNMVFDKHSVSTSKEFFFKSCDNGRTWTVYHGCELLVGDTTLNICVTAMLDACNERLVSIWK